MTETEIKEAAEKDIAKITVVETSASGWIKTHFAVIGAVICFILGFIGGWAAHT